MNRMSKQLRMGSSALAIITAASLLATHAMAQDATATAAATPAPAGNEVQELVVTGTSIKGISPVGSNVMTVGVQEIKNMGVSGITEVLKGVPSLEFFGSAGRAPTTGTNGQPGVAVQIHQVGAMSSASTLTLIDSHRAILSGITNYYVDPNQIPTNMLQRVEVLADGSSAVYGSDAIAGVVNFITRSRFDGIQLEGQTTIQDGAKNYQASALFGHSWDTGGFVLGASYTQFGELTNTDRAFTDPLAQTARAAAAGVTGPSTSNFGNFFCSPATIAPAGQSLIFTSPTSGVAVANAADNQTCSQWAAGSLLPRENRVNAMLKVNQKFGDRLTLDADLLLYHRRNKQRVSRGTVQGTAFGTGAQANPFYRLPAGYTGTATSETVRYSFDELLGPGAVSMGGVETYSAKVNLNYKISDDWSLDFLASAGKSDTNVDTFGTVNGAAALLALNGTGQQNGSTTATVIPGFNTVTLNLPLTTANALDVWNPAASNRTSQAVRNQLVDSKGTSHGYHDQVNLRLSLSGSLFQLPAGAVKVAAGVEMLNYNEQQIGTNPGNAAPRSVDSLFYSYHFGRRDKAAYIEAVVPVVSPEMSVPFAKKIDVTVAGRVDKYSDVGTTKNPKIGVNWDLMDGLRLRGNWSTSFVAPVLTLVGGSQALANFSNVAGSSGPGSIPVQYYPQVTQFGIPGCTTASATCNISTLQGITAGLGGGPTMTPADGKTYSIGVDFSPSWLPGFSGNLTRWSNTISNAVATPQFAVAVTNPTLLDHLTLYPSCATAAQIDAFTKSRSGFPVPQTSAFPACVQFTNLSISDNYLYLWVKGYDLQLNQRFQTDIGEFRVGMSGTLITTFDNAYSYKKKPTKDQIFSTLNTEGINTGYPALSKTARGNVSWSNWGFRADLYANYSGSYKNISASAKTPLVNNANNVYSGQGGDRVKSTTSYDLHLGYDIPGEFLGSKSIDLTINNLFDKDPPFYNASAGYDVFLGSPIGRNVTLNFKSKF
jgi:iron complex outermembrane receptor protein